MAVTDNKAVKISAFGGVEWLCIEAYDAGAAAGAQVKVRVHAAGLNRADVLQRRGLYPAPVGSLPDAALNVPGLEFAGEVEALGPDVKHAALGQRVMGVVAGGAMATTLLVDEAQLLPIPDGLGFSEAAALPEALMTAMDALLNQALLRAGEVVLVHAAASGVGIATWQLAQAWDAKVWGTTRTPQKLEVLLGMGLQQGLCVSDATFADAFKAQAGGGAGVIVDLVGAAYFDENMKALAPQGVMVHVGLVGGSKTTLDLARLLEKRARLVGTVLRSRSASEKAQLCAQFAATVLPLVQSKQIGATIDCVMPMTRVREAHQKLERNDTLGKIVLTW